MKVGCHTIEQHLLQHHTAISLNGPFMKHLHLTVLTSALIAFAGLTSCAAPTSHTETLSATPESGQLPEPTAADSTPPSTLAQAPAAPSQNASTPNSPASENQVTQRPQLIKKATLSLEVASVKESFAQVREIVNTQQGDVLSLNDSGGDVTEEIAQKRRQITFEMRVPAQNLDNTLDALTELGKVGDRTITSEDVSAQLVDTQARITNSRKSEAALQEIMSRSGDISDVLEVSRELSQVRQNIEQMSARQESLKAQVRYSTITLNLETTVAPSETSAQPTFSRQIKDSWQSATNSVGDFTTDLLQIGIWLLAYSPYLAVLLCGALVIKKATRPST